MKTTTDVKILKNYAPKFTIVQRVKIPSMTKNIGKREPSLLSERAVKLVNNIVDEQTLNVKSQTKKEDYYRGGFIAGDTGSN